MPPLRALRSLAAPASLSALVFALTACKTNHKSHEAPSPSGPPSSSARPTADQDFKPLHPGHLNQRDPKGGFIQPLTAPPPSPMSQPKLIAFDVPPEAKLPPLKAENGHCGELDLGGGEKVVLDCITDDYSMVANAAQPVASAEDLRSLRNPRKLPAVVDHRKDNTEGPILNQGKSSSCTAFSLTSAVAHAAAHYLGEPPDLSPMHVWARYHSPSMKLAEDDNIGRGVADQATFPFDAHLANEWQKNEKRVDSRELHRADEKALVEITNITRLDGGSMTEIKSALAAGQDVWFSLKGAHGLMHPKKNAEGESMIPDFDYRRSGGARGGHAILLSGYEDTPHGTYYLVHNSWGPKWGTDGYAWMWEKTLRANINDAYVLQVRPTSNAHVKRPPIAHQFATAGACTGNLVPDAVTTQCVPPCADGGPRVNGVCPTAGQCPDGEVNLVGKCELSAPVINKTLSNGVKVTCGISGCVYVVPNGQNTCTEPSGCTVSCAAPRFMLGSGSRGLTCNG
jgi:hypothetical protein